MGRVFAWQVLLALIVAGCHSRPENSVIMGADMDYAAARRRMVEEQLRGFGRDVTNVAVLDAMGTVPRHEFMPESVRAHAYDDFPLPIGYGQTISQPYIVAFMTEQLNPQPTD